jgi:hypothetical protein
LQDSEKAFNLHPPSAPGNRFGHLSGDQGMAQLKTDVGAKIMANHCILCGKQGDDIGYSSSVKNIVLSPLCQKCQEYCEQNPNSVTTVYTHLFNPITSDVDKNTVSPEASIDRPIDCPICEEVNIATTEYCVKCYNPLKYKKYKGVKGWLFFLVLILTAAYPLTYIMVLGDAITHLEADWGYKQVDPPERAALGKQIFVL